MPTFEEMRRDEDWSAVEDWLEELASGLEECVGTLMEAQKLLREWLRDYSPSDYGSSGQSCVWAGQMKVCGQDVPRCIVCRTNEILGLSEASD